MNTGYAIYNEQGAVVVIGSAPQDLLSAQPLGVGQYIIEAPSNVNWDYWVDITTTPHTLHQKTAHPLTIGATTINADGEDECVITGIHNPSTVIWPDGFVETVTDGEVRFSVDLAGEYAITIEAIPYLKETINVQALPAN